jgi:hypothetical protein
MDFKEKKKFNSLGNAEVLLLELHQKKDNIMVALSIIGVQKLSVSF